MLLIAGPKVHPELEAGLERLLTWSAGTSVANRDDLQREFGGVVGTITRQFADDIGLWPNDLT